MISIKKENKMKKYLKISFIYAICALIGGVFYREFTKFNNFTGVTALGKIHVHLIVLGAIMFLILALFTKHIEFEKSKLYLPFMITYNFGIGFTVLMFIVRGIYQVLEINLANRINTLISTFAGIGHIALGTGVVLLFIMLIKCAKDEKKVND